MLAQHACDRRAILNLNNLEVTIMADDIVDTIAQYDLDEDFPPYANDQNKELNQIVREKVRLVAQLGLEIEEH